MTWAKRAAGVRDRAFGRGLAAAVGVAAVLATGALPAQAAENPYQRGPDPTLAALAASAGPYPIMETVVGSAEVTNFGGASIYYPAGTADGTFGGVAVTPGFLGPRSTMEWVARRVASHGFVVINIDTLERNDTPPLRARQMLAALDYLTGASAVRDRVDPTRLAVMGHSMGGGGSLQASRQRPQLKAAVPLTPWSNDKDFSADVVPTLIIGAELDDTAPVAEHAEPFFESIAAARKAYLELNDAEHRAPIRTNETIGTYSVAWLKRFVDDDTRYEQFLCPPPAPSAAIEEFRGTCPSS
ncbi:poly(ethylene terephthalate) hydrolase family protein [Jidongwangia harbinensis]|uniref:poly(ethylene terephthalate) hydrolase family protein n=1 Tax=Jidongwangia harbinensis TaxID=2878561 RepID=UPI001CD93C96|nr:dienelactone hydrolase family protein [Jidongwangia harbinensis]MCA2214137.1 dienelactone hydrolase family protein [Jidongwangia harbinensis]